MRLTRKIRPGISVRSHPDSGHFGHPTLHPPDSSGAGDEVGVPLNFSSSWGWVWFCAGKAWNLRPEGTGLGGSGLSVQPKGLVRWHQSVLISCMRNGVHG